jgi:hypothetical protein
VKDWRELLASRAWWVMLALIGPLVGISFISAVRTYSELSVAGGSGAGVGSCCPSSPSGSSPAIGRAVR